MNDTFIKSFKTTWHQELRVLSKMARKLHNQLRAQKEFRILNELIRKAKDINNTTELLLTEFDRQKRLALLKNFFKICSKTSDVCIKYGEYSHSYIERKFLLEFSTLSYACTSRFYYLLKEIQPFLNKLFKREKALLQSEQQKIQKEMGVILIEDSIENI